MSRVDHREIAFERGDFESARALFEEAASAGDAPAARWFMTAFVEHKNGDGIHEMHGMVGAMSEDELWAVARPGDGESVAATFLSLREN
jgi:hypothetical protein